MLRRIKISIFSLCRMYIFHIVGVERAKGQLVAAKKPRKGQWEMRQRLPQQTIFLGWHQVDAKINQTRPIFIFIGGAASSVKLFFCFLCTFASCLSLKFRAASVLLLLRRISFIISPLQFANLRKVAVFSEKKSFTTFPSTANLIFAPKQSVTIKFDSTRRINLNCLLDKNITIKLLKM